MAALSQRIRAMILAGTGRRPHASRSWKTAGPGGPAASGRARPGWLARLTGRSPSAGQPPDHSGPAGSVSGRHIAGRRRMAVLLVLALSLVAGLASFRIGTVDASRLSRIPGIDSTPGGSRQAESEHYRQTLMDANSINADAADRSGSSYITIPESVPEQIPDWASTEILPGTNASEGVGVEFQPAEDARDEAAAEILPEPEAAPDPLTAANAVPTGDWLVSPGSQGEDGQSDGAARSANPADAAPMPAAPDADPGSDHHTGPAPDQYAEAILGQMTAILRNMAISEPESVLLSRPEADAPSGGDPLPGGADHLAMVSIPAGTILQGETVNTVTSDQASPVVVEISGGDLAGARVIGRFSVSESAGGLVVEFDRLATPSGIQRDVEAVAVDAFDTGPAVASSIDRRLARRFGPGLLTSMVTGFAESASRPSMEVVEIGGSAAVASGTSTTRQSVIAGMGRAAGRIVEDLAGSLPAGPEIRLEAGHPVGILFVASADIPI